MEDNIHPERLQIGAEINWEQVRNNASVAALQGIVSSSTHWDEHYYIFKGISEEKAAQHAVSFADSLVAELRKRYEDTDK